jgi:hypothetical protein
VRVHAALLVLSAELTAVAASPPALAGPPTLDAALAAHYKGSPPFSYKYALVDLNGDGVLDAVVLITDRFYCGSGGCNMAILRGTGDSFAYVSGSTISREPIRVLTESRHGWKSLSVAVAGGGVKSGDVVMRFNGKRYPLNPTMQPYATAADIAGAKELDLKE